MVEYQLPSRDICQRARLNRDARFDGLFFTGVLSTGIYCRPICPAPCPKEENVQYFVTAQAAAAKGLRPCLRCRPESAPGSSPWRGTVTTLGRAMALIDEGALNSSSVEGDTQAMEVLSSRLGIGSRYLRKLFKEKLGTSPKAYADYRRLLFAKSLLHQTSLSVTDVAYAAGFGSVRRFNEVFREQLALTPSAVRRSLSVTESGLVLSLSYRPPYNFMMLRAFFMARAIQGVEWFFTEHGEPCYGRTLTVAGEPGWFEVWQVTDSTTLRVRIFPGNKLSSLMQWLAEIRRVMDLDANLPLIEGHLSQLMAPEKLTIMALPGTGNFFEAACRAVLGQQVSLKQATSLLNVLVQTTSEEKMLGNRRCRVFPEPATVAEASLTALKVPQVRTKALLSIAALFREQTEPSPKELLGLKGIGQWTVSYARMRGLSEPDILLGEDLVIRQRLSALYRSSGENRTAQEVSQSASPWGSYLTLALWQTGLSTSSLNTDGS